MPAAMYVQAPPASGEERHYAFEKANWPDEWNTLDQAAAWFARHTGKPWGVRDVLNAAIRYPVGENPPGASNRCTAIGVALPDGHQIMHAFVNAGEGRAELEKQGRLPDALKNEGIIPVYPLSWRPVALLQLGARQLLAAGWVKVEIARTWHLDRYSEDRQIDIIDPPFVARPEHVGIARHQLLELANLCRDYRPAGAAVANQGAPDLQGEAPPEKWRRGIRRVAWDAAITIFSRGEKLTSENLENAMFDSQKVEWKNGEYQLKSTAGDLNNRDMTAKPKTIAGWATALKKVLKQ